ncbi:hypothetical protein Pve01_76970 [Planomonospora venezuelensis]|nr:hypothetical protein Pve01_76970 [Planomonospora venezuelensis]
MLDISHEALAVTRRRLGSTEGRLAYVVSDVLSWHPARTYDAWHDRAALHFLTAPADQAAYVDPEPSRRSRGDPDRLLSS